MRVQVRLPAASLRCWHQVLLEKMASTPGASISVELASSATAVTKMGRRLESVFALESHLHRYTRYLSKPISADSFRRYRDSAGPADIMLDLTENPLNDEHVWRLEYDGQVGEAAALRALCSGRMPLVALVDSNSRKIATGRPGTEQPRLLVAAFEDISAGCLSLILGAVRGKPFAAPDSLSIGPVGPPPSLLRYLGSQFTWAFARCAYRALYRSPHWRVGWRYVDPLSDCTEINQPWNFMPDDGRHFYADPFPFEHGGRLFVFVEDYDHRVGRGVISVAEFGENGPLSVPRPVLSCAVHLSYPFIVEDSNQILMIPETSALRRIELYRADTFPDQWSRVGTLIENVEASDATVFFYRQRWWMTATVRELGSYSDALYVWYSDTLVGPWQPHRNNPVLLDIASARPAGRVVYQDGRLLRPVQDNRGGYGAALAIAEITQLDEDHFQQKVLHRMSPGPWWPGRRLHTINRAGSLQCIDGSGRSPRFRPARRLVRV